jgi:hypothetical protein
MIVPWQETIRIQPYHRVTRTVVRLDPEDAHWLSGSKGNRQLMLAKMQLETLAEAGGMTTVVSEPVTTPHEEITMWHFVGEYTGADGDKKRVDKHYELDMRTKDRDEKDGGYIMFARSQAWSKVEKIKRFPERQHKTGMPALDDDEGWKKWVEARARKEWEQTYRHRTRLAETGAMLAAYRSAFNLKGVYDEADFAIPWAIYRVEFDMAAAIQSGGEVGRMAQRSLGLVMGRFLGIPADVALEGLGAPEANQLPEPANSDFLPAPDDEIDEIERLMIEAGFKERRAIDYRIREIFDVSLSQLTRRHARIMREYLEIGQVARENIKDKEEMAGFVQHLYQVMRLCYNTDKTIEEEIEQVWWNAAHGIVEEHDDDAKTVNGHVETMMSVPAPGKKDQPESEEEDEPASGEENDE